jgi:hypothetical protein
MPPIIKHLKSPSSVYEIQGGGQVCLTMMSSGQWTMQVQEPDTVFPGWDAEKGCGYDPGA